MARTSTRTLAHSRLRTNAATPRTHTRLNGRVHMRLPNAHIRAYTRTRTNASTHERSHTYTYVYAALTLYTCMRARRWQYVHGTACTTSTIYATTVLVTGGTICAILQSSTSYENQHGRRRFVVAKIKFIASTFFGFGCHENSTNGLL